MPTMPRHLPKELTKHIRLTEAAHDAVKQQLRGGETYSDCILRAFQHYATCPKTPVR